MYKAYDTILQSEVSAGVVVQNGEFEPYRYECACCGEEVYVAAPYSKRITAHFRHRSGNNDVACEKYLGQHEAINIDSLSRRNNREKADFYYDNARKVFRLAIRFSEDEIRNYERQNIDFELSTKELDASFYTLKINSTNFMPNVPAMIDLNYFSFEYYLTNTCSCVKRKYNFFNRGNGPTFFKIQSNDDNFKAKLVGGAVLFTNSQYLFVFENQYLLPQESCFPDGLEISQTFHFETAGRKFLAYVASIPNKTAMIDYLLESWGYKLETSETLTLLWPPASITDDVNVIDSNFAYVFTSFALQAHGNINIHSKNIIQLDSGISKILVNQRIKIYKKNAEIDIKKTALPVYDYSVITPSREMASYFVIPAEGFYILFNRVGVVPLMPGQKKFLTPNCRIVQYMHNYPIGYVCPCNPEKQTEDELFKDILAHYKRVEIFDAVMFNSHVFSEMIYQYIVQCKRSGLINSVIKRYIEEGLL